MTLSAVQPAAPFRGVLVGLGRMGGNHLRVLAAHDGVDLVAVVDVAPERRAAAVARHPGLRAFADLGEALREVEADFACVAAPAPALPALALQGLEAGLAVLVEKPMAPDEAAAAEVLRVAEARGALVAAGHVERFNPAVMLLKEKLAAGELGHIHQVHARRLSPFPARDSMVGVSLDLATHDLDIIRHLTGSEVARVYAEVTAREGSRTEDLIGASLRMDDGTAALLEVNWLTPTKVRELTVTGERGMFVVNYLTQDLFFYENPRANISWDALNVVRGTGEGNMVRYALDRREPLLVQWDAFLAALAGQRPPGASGHDGLAALSVARAIQESGATHQVVVPAYRRLAAAVP